MLPIITTVLLTLALQSTSADPWTNLRFFVGKWEGTSSGQPGNGTVSRSYEFVLANKYLQVRNKSTDAPQEKNPKGEVHEDWGFFSHDSARKKVMLRQFHVEGFVNQYVIQSKSRTELVFTSEPIENIPAGFRARETYRILGPDNFEERFEIAEPGKDFELYSETKFHRVRNGEGK